LIAVSIGARGYQSFLKIGIGSDPAHLPGKSSAINTCVHAITISDLQDELEIRICCIEYIPCYLL